MAKTQYLTFEVHLNDPARVAELQANPPGQTSDQGGTDGQKAIIRAPYNATPPGYGAAVEFQDNALPDAGGAFTVDAPSPLPMIGPRDTAPIGSPYLYSEWFTSENNFPRDFASFQRKSGGWFGLPFLFGKTTRYYWRGIFLLDPLATSTDPDDVDGACPIPIRRWLDGFQTGGAAAGVNNPGGTTSEQDRALSRDAARAVDGYGFAMRGVVGTRLHTTTEFSTGGAATENETWERLYIRLRRLPTGAPANVQFWRARSRVNNTAGAKCYITPTGQIAVYNVDSAAVETLLASTNALELNRWYKLDLIILFNLYAANKEGVIWVYLNGQQAFTVTIPAAMGGVGLNSPEHASSEIGTDQASGYTLEMDIGYWHGAKIPTDPQVSEGSDRTLVDPVNGPPSQTLKFNGLDFKHGSRAVLIRPRATVAAHTGWTSFWARLLQRPVRPLSEGLDSTTSGAILAVDTDFAASVNNVPGSLGLATFIVEMFSCKGSTNGTLGYVLNGAAAVMAACAQRLGPTLGWNSVRYSPTGVRVPGAITGLELRHVKGADVDPATVSHLTATAELIGTFGDEDYPPDIAEDVRNPLPFVGVHNAPYPRTPWARSITPPIAPVIIKSGEYVGDSAGRTLTFKAPIHWLFIRKKVAAASVPLTVRWWSSMLAAVIDERDGVDGSLMPDIGIDPDFSVVTTAHVPTDAPATAPDRSAQVAAIVAVTENAALLTTGSDDDKRQLLEVIIRALNLTDGNNWGLLQKPSTIPSDIIVWHPSLEHFDVLTDTGATWIADGVINGAWSWKEVKAEGQQEEQTIVRIAGTNNEINTNGASYVYVAIADPGMRFMLNGATSHRSEALPVIHALIDAGFTPLGGWFSDQRPGNATNHRMFYKGPGNAAAAVSDLPGNQKTPAVTFGAGQLTVESGVIYGSSDSSLAFSLFRMDDLSDDPGKANVVRMLTYTGNGAGGTRSIALPNASGKRPLWAAVFPNTGAAYGFFKDATHSGGKSMSFEEGLESTTAIVTGAPDEITVGVTLNVNTTVYNVFVIMGDTAAGAAGDGFSEHGEFAPVEPDRTTSGAFGEEAEEPVDPGTDADTPGDDTPGDPGGGTDDIDTDLDTVCVPYTKRIFNQALTRIGISKRVVNAATDNTQEADVLRGAYAQSVLETLHDFPWPFATRWARLTLISGSPAAPANRDWTYSYRQPSDCVFERRIVVVREGAVDPEPPPFQLSFDNALNVNRILTNEASATLEYTARPECAAGRSDPLFLEALIWKLASKAAGPLTRIADVIKVSETAYEAAIEKARRVIRPGNPGPRLTDVDPNAYDAGTGALEANVAVINRGLLRIGAATVANVWTEQSREAEGARLIFEEELRSTLRDYSWSFATRYDNGLTLLGGTASVSVNDDWQYSYRLPVDCVKVRRLVTGLRRAYEPNPEIFITTTDEVGGVLYTNAVTPSIEYTARIPDCVLHSDPLFRDTLGWRMAACLAPALAQVDPAQVEQQGRGPLDRPRERKATEAQLRERQAMAAWRQYYLAIEKARLADAQAQQQDPNTGDAPWITGRN